MRLAIVIPAHDEAAVIEQKIWNTHGLELPAVGEGQPFAHLAVVVDDHSSDDTMARAIAAVQSLPARSDLEWRVVASQHRPGKGGALASGFAEAAGFEIVILTDADSWVSSRAAIETVQAFADPAVGAVSGAQRYVEAIEGGVPHGDRADLYDSLSEAVRRIESRRGMLFSVHGPWLALRAAAGAEPKLGIAADDLDLALQVRAAGYRVVLAERAVYCEIKAKGVPLFEQRIRRARAYFEIVDLYLPRMLAIAPRPLGAVQLAGYWIAPVAAALLFLAGILAPIVLAMRSESGPGVQWATMLAVGGLLLLEPFHTCVAYAAVILGARLSPMRRSGADRWRRRFQSEG